MGARSGLSVNSRAHSQETSRPLPWSTGYERLTCETHQVNNKNKKVRTKGKRKQNDVSTRVNTVAVADPHNGLAFPAAKQLGSMVRTGLSPAWKEEAYVLLQE